MNTCAQWLASLSLVVVAYSLEAQSPSNPRDLIGSINIEEQEERRVDPYPAAQSATLEYFQNYNSKLQSIAHSGSGSLGDLSDDMLNYLSALYLHCSVNYGVCPYILNAVLEIDVINSKNSGSAGCPNMKRLWNAWVRNNLEERHKYLVKTSFIQATSDFKAKDRPRYLKCDQTITDILKNSAGSAQFFKARYTEGSEYFQAAPKITALITQVIEKDQIPNLFIKYGVTQTDSGAAAARSAGAGGGSGASTKKQRK